MKQFDLQGNEYDCNIEFPTDITDVSFRFSKDALFKSWQDEALRHREEILQLKAQLQQKENIIKEVREKIKEFCWDYEYETYSNMTSNEVKELAELLESQV